MSMIHNFDDGLVKPDEPVTALTRTKAKLFCGVPFSFFSLFPAADIEAI